MILKDEMNNAKKDFNVKKELEELLKINSKNNNAEYYELS